MDKSRLKKPLPRQSSDICSGAHSSLSGVLRGGSVPLGARAAQNRLRHARLPGLWPDRAAFCRFILNRSLLLTSQHVIPKKDKETLAFRLFANLFSRVYKTAPAGHTKPASIVFFTNCSHLTNDTHEKQ
ncbi:hypothetical protein, partial [Desulfovibrio porci]|uniref:hypothetical protein n=1 Tax=Desulfovibrio porci TaxID=2605782 RepID=UPI003A8D258A